MYIKPTYVADFETIERNGREEVWLWDVCNVVTKQHTTGTELEDFWNHLDKLRCSSTIYFHNLRFDGSFIIDFLLKNGYMYNDVKTNRLHKKEFSTLITDMGQYFSVNYRNKMGKIVNIWDSAKLIPLSVRQMSEDFNLSTYKGEIDYKKPRPKGYIPSNIELDYVRRDTEIVADVLTQFKEEGFDKMTLSSCAFDINRLIMGNDYKKHFGWWESHANDCIDKYIQFKFDDNEELRDKTLDSYMRRAYRGGFCATNPKHINTTVREPVYYYDVNSKYPYEMVNSPLPVGQPVPFEGQYIDDEEYPLYIQRIIVDCELKKDGIACILIKNKGVGNKYLEDSDGVIPLTLTNLDLELLENNYEIFHIDYIDGFKFRSKCGLFDAYISHFMEMKIMAEKEGKKGKRKIAKLSMNSLYGKFGQNPLRRKKLPTVDEFKLKLLRCDETTSEKCNYLPVAIFVCAWGRYHILEDIYKIEKIKPGSWVYTDTDSILSTMKLDETVCHETELGKYKIEYIFRKSRYLGPKTYWGLTTDNNIVCKACGCNSNALRNLPIGKFNYNEQIKNGKVYLKTVEGGKRLVSDEFKIRNRFDDKRR